MSIRWIEAPGVAPPWVLEEKFEGLDTWNTCSVCPSSKNLGFFMKLTQKKCLPCEGGLPKLQPAEVERLLMRIDQWQLAGEKLQKSFRWKDFRQAMAFVQQIALLAEAEGHHPDFSVHYNQVEVTIWTHAIGGLSENDFILAAKIDAL